MGESSRKPVRGSWTSALTLLALAAAAAAVAVFPSATASSYNGTGDWTIDANVTEVVVGESITVSGMVFVNGSLELVNSSLLVMGRIDTPPPPPPNPPARESAKVYVNGSLTLTNATLIFFMPFGGPPIPGLTSNIPPGFRAGPNANLTLRDGDGDPATPGDASVLTATGFPESLRNGSYSNFSAGSRFSMRNSRAEWLGFEGFPGLEFNGSIVTIEGSRFNFSKNATVMNNCLVVVVVNSTFEDVEQPVNLRAGSGTRLENLTLVNMTVGIQVTGSAGTQVRNISVLHGIGQFFYSGWAPPGTVLALNGTVDLTVVGLRLVGNFSGGNFETIRPVMALLGSRLSVHDVEVENVSSLGRIEAVAGVLLERVRVAGFLSGLIISGCVNVTVRDVSLVGGTLIALEVEATRALSVTNYTAEAGVGLLSEGTFPVTVDGANLTVVQTGLAVWDGSDVTVRGARVKGNGTAISAHNITRLTLDRPEVRFSYVGIQITYSNQVTVSAPNVIAEPGGPSAKGLFFVAVTDASVSGVLMSGSCETAARIDNSQRITIDGVDAAGCGAGFDISNSGNLTLRSLDLSGSWNGSGISLSLVADVTVDGANVSGAWGYAIAAGAAQRVLLAFIDGRSAGGGGFVALQCAEIDLMYSDFSGSNGTGVGVYNSTGRVSLLRLNVSGGGSGVDLFGSPRVSLQDIVASSNRREGVFVDPASGGASLRNLTLNGNGADGLFVTAAGVLFVDGNVSANGGDGVASGRAVRLDWTIEVAGSIVDDEVRHTGVLLVLAGARFEARNVRLLMDEGTSFTDPPPDARIEVRSIALFENVTLGPVNASRAHGILFGQSSRIEILGSSWTGGAPASVASAVDARGALTVSNSSFTGWWQPLLFDGGQVDVRDTRFVDNGWGPSFRSGDAYLENLTVENSGADGLTLADLASARVVGGLVYLSAGAGLRADHVQSLTLDGVRLWLNLGGGAFINECEVTANGVVAESNLGLGVQVSGGATARFTDFKAESNTGATLAFIGTQSVVVENASIRFPGGTGLAIEGAASATVRGGDIVRSGAYGLTVLDVADLLIEGVLIEGSAGAQLRLGGATVGAARNCTFRDSPGDAVVVEGAARLTVLGALVEGTAGRVYARDQAYAYVLNASFASPAAESLGQVDVAWNASVRVMLGSGGPAAAAQLEILNAAGVSVAIESAGADGRLPTIAVLEKRVFEGGRVERSTPHLFEARLAGQGSALANITVDRFTVVTLTLDDILPSVTLRVDGSLGAGGWYIDAPTLTFEAIDEGVSGVTVFWRTAPGPWQSLFSASSVASAVVLMSAEGESHVEYYAADGAGNNVAVATVVVRVDLAAPTAAWGPVPPTVRGANVSLTWSGEDGAGSGVAGFAIAYSFDSGPFHLWRSGSTASRDVFEGEEGRYTFRLTATDVSGRESRAEVLDVEFFVMGTLRLAVVGRDGLPVATAAVEVVGTNLSQTGGGALSFRLPEGSYVIAVRAPGYGERVFSVNITAGNATDLGEVTLEELRVEGVGGGLVLLLAGAGLAVAAAVALLLVRARSSRRPPEEK